MVTTGAALAEKLKKTDRVAVAIFGDGTGSRGSIHESMVFAAAWKLPVLFVIQNNQYAMGTSVRKTYAVEDLSCRAKAYGFPGKSVDGNDVVAIYEASSEYIDRARRGDGPALIAAETYRLYGHYEGDPEKYRPEGEAQEWAKRDPIPRYTQELLKGGIATKEDLERIGKEAEKEIEDGISAARALPRWNREDYVKNCIAEL
jgi:acetoin:2,6-dichlorophenolindophenol oxidoreductase subunit alpha